MSKIFQYPFLPMTDGIGKPKDLSGDQADVPYLGVYAVETTKRFIPGTRFITWDGRVFKYGYSVSAVIPYHGCHAGEAGAESYTASPSTTAIGSLHVTTTLASRSEDDLAGGYFVLYHSTINNTTQYGIVGNDATSGSTTKLYLDSPLAYASTITTFYHEVFENPYRECSHATNSATTYGGWLGVPMMNASSEYFWMQTWGPCLVSGGAALEDNHYKTYRWGQNNVIYQEGRSEASTDYNQIAGWKLQGDGGAAGPLIMLMCST